MGWPLAVCHKLALRDPFTGNKAKHIQPLKHAASCLARHPWWQTAWRPHGGNPLSLGAKQSLIRLRKQQSFTLVSCSWQLRTIAGRLLQSKP